MLEVILSKHEIDMSSNRVINKLRRDFDLEDFYNKAMSSPQFNKDQTKKTVQILARSMGVTNLLIEKLRGSITTDDSVSYDQWQKAIVVYSIYVGAKYGKEHIQSLTKEYGEFPEIQNLDFSKRFYALENTLMDYVMKLAKASGNSYTFSCALNSHFENLISETMKLRDDPELVPVFEAIQKKTIKVNGSIYSGFTETEDFAMDFNNIEEIDEDEFIGDKSYVDDMFTSVLQMSMYDFEKGLNPWPKNTIKTTFLLAGETGTGKTFGAALLMNKAKKHFDKHGLPIRLIFLDEDFKSGIYSESSKKLRKKLNSVNDPHFFHIIWCDEIDTVFFSRDSDKLNNENKSNFGVLVRFLSGVEKHPNNYIFIAATNFISANDAALLSRLGTPIEVIGPRKAEDFIKLFQNHFFKIMDKSYVKLTDKEWIDIGNMCESYDLRARHAKKIIEEIHEKIINRSKITKEAINMPIEQKMKYVLTCFNPVTYEVIKNHLQGLMNSAQMEKERQYRKDVKDKIYEISVYAAAKSSFSNNMPISPY